MHWFIIRYFFCRAFSSQTAEANFFENSLAANYVTSEFKFEKI